MSSENRPCYSAWTDEPEAYSIRCMNMMADETQEDYVTLDMVRSYDLEYDEEGMLIDAKEPQGYLTSEAAKLVKINSWLNSNAEEMMEGIDCIIFPGGKDISPTLRYEEQPWNGIEEEADFSAERDVSDYLLMSYCIDHDIPMLAICRGMQMLSVISGAKIIEDLPVWFEEQGVEYHDEHRDPEKKDLVPHSVNILAEDSLLYEIVGQKTLAGCPSWHHQAVGDVSGTRLTVVAETMTDGLPVIEGVERQDRTFCMGLQFHPEVAVGKALNQEANAGDFLDYETAMSFFEALIEAGKEGQEAEKEQKEQVAAAA